MRPLAEQTILITGSTDGHGRRVAELLVERAATVLVHGRDAGKVARVVGEIGAARGLTADLASLDEVRRLADEVDELDTLVNNAGIVTGRREESADGHELTFAVNHLAHFLLTLLLLDKLDEPARIVNVASIGQMPLDFDDLEFERGWEGYPAYAKSKLAQVMFTMELSQRLAGRDVSVNAIHPATLMDTNMVRNSLGRSLSTVEEGAEATLRLIADPQFDGVSGRFFDGKRESQAAPQAYDAEARRRLWDESSRLAGVA
jgi:NAD(P)-dependent dehydrogenase (short-subunit alcohol dehydrogenase family)